MPCVPFQFATKGELPT